MDEPLSSENREQYSRMWRATDTALTAHSALRDRYKRFELTLVVLIVCASSISATFAFVSENPKATFLGIEARRSTWIGIVSLSAVLLAFVQLIVRCGEKAGEHHDAVRRLSQLKATFRTIDAAGLNRGAFDEVLLGYDAAMAAIPAVPERLFLALKARHQRKLAVSRLIDKRPGAPVWLLRCEVMTKALRRSRPVDQVSEAPSPPVP